MSSRAVKLMFCLRRREDLTREEFQAYWHDKHGQRGIALQPGLGYERYVQSHTLSGDLNDSLRVSRGAPEAFDGVVELWFESVEAIQETFSGAEGRRAARELLTDERNFVDLEASPIFVVEEYAMWPSAVSSDA